MIYLNYQRSFVACRQSQNLGLPLGNGGYQPKAWCAKGSRSRSELTADSTYLFSACEETYEEETDEVENWIGCDHCNRWYHWVCVGVVTEPEFFHCNVCTQ